MLAVQPSGIGCWSARAPLYSGGCTPPPPLYSGGCTPPLYAGGYTPPQYQTHFPSSRLCEHNGLSSPMTPYEQNLFCSPRMRLYEQTIACQSSPMKPYASSLTDTSSSPMYSSRVLAPMLSQPSRLQSAPSISTVHSQYCATPPMPSHTMLRMTSVPSLSCAQHHPLFSPWGRGVEKLQSIDRSEIVVRESRASKVLSSRSRSPEVPIADSKRSRSLSPGGGGEKAPKKNGRSRSPKRMEKSNKPGEPLKCQLHRKAKSWCKVCRKYEQSTQPEDNADKPAAQAKSEAAKRRTVKENPRLRIAISKNEILQTKVQALAASALKFNQSKLETVEKVRQRSASPNTIKREEKAVASSGVGPGPDHSIPPQAAGFVSDAFAPKNVYNRELRQAASDQSATPAKVPSRSPSPVESTKPSKKPSRAPSPLPSNKTLPVTSDKLPSASKLRSRSPSPSNQKISVTKSRSTSPSHNKGQSQNMATVVQESNDAREALRVERSIEGRSSRSRRPITSMEKPTPVEKPTRLITPVEKPTRLTNVREQVTSTQRLSQPRSRDASPPAKNEPRTPAGLQMPKPKAPGKAEQARSRSASPMAENEQHAPTKLTMPKAPKAPGKSQNPRSRSASPLAKNEQHGLKGPPMPTPPSKSELQVNEISHKAVESSDVTSDNIPVSLGDSQEYKQFSNLADSRSGHPRCTYKKQIAYEKVAIAVPAEQQSIASYFSLQEVEAEPSYAAQTHMPMAKVQVDEIDENAESSDATPKPSQCATPGHMSCPIPMPFGMEIQPIPHPSFARKAPSSQNVPSLGAFETGLNSTQLNSDATRENLPLSDLLTRFKDGFGSHKFNNGTDCSQAVLRGGTLIEVAMQLYREGNSEFGVNTI